MPMLGCNEFATMGDIVAQGHLIGRWITSCPEIPEIFSPLRCELLDLSSFAYEFQNPSNLARELQIF